MDLKHIGRIVATVIILVAILLVLYGFIYLPYKWEFTGFVTDSNGDPISGVEVNLLSEGEETGKSISTKTDDNGFYKFSSNILTYDRIPIGVYKINVSQVLPSGEYYVGYTGGMIQLTGKDIKKDILWIRRDEAKRAEDMALDNYDMGVRFVVYQVRPNESAGGGGAGAGMFWVRVDLTGLGEGYGIQIENAPGDNVSSSLMEHDTVLRTARSVKDSVVVDVDSRVEGKYLKFLNAIVFAGLEGAKIREGVYRLTANQREVYFATVTTGIFAEDIYDADGNWVGRSNYSDMCIMSKGYLERYFEIVNSKTVGGEERVEFRCRDSEEAWKKYKYVCTMSQHCDNSVAMKYDLGCGM